MAPIVTSAEIGRPDAEVFACATDPARFSEWQKGVVDGHMDGPAGGTGTPAAGGGLSLDEKFFPRGPQFRGLRVHQIRLQGGDASSDSYCYRS